ncbi:MAG: O-antigen ligase family protein [Brevundimonas sp.]|nr:MAG: O-antigen ligase family protein [Brevundimonas sp.]
MAALGLLAFSILFGGASRQHELRLALVELAALPLLVLAILRLRYPDLKTHRYVLSVLGCVALLPLIQLIPLPPAIWTNLPHREELVVALQLADLEPGWTTLSLTPDRTWRSFLALIPPIAMFLGVLACRPPQKTVFAWFIVAATTAAILLGTAQLASGGTGLYLWRTTDAGNVVGFFANRNHLATMCLVSMPFAIMLGANSLRNQGGRLRLPFWLGVFFTGLAVVGLGVIRSRAGVAIVVPVMAASLFGAWIASGRGRPSFLLLALVAGATLAAIAVSIFAIGPLLARFDTGGAAEGRLENWPIVMAAAEAYLPLGSGFGSFDSVFRSVEPLQTLDSTFFNQAHNDYLETWLESGWLGMMVLVAFLGWFGKRALQAWRAAPSIERDLQRAASIAIGAVLIHSAVDYPLRTVAITTLFALCCGLLESAHLPDMVRTRSRRRQTP